MWYPIESFSWLRAAVDKYLRQKSDLSALKWWRCILEVLRWAVRGSRTVLFILWWLTVTCWQLYVTTILGSTLGILRAYVRLPIKSLWKPSRAISMMTAGYVYALWFPAVCHEFRISISSLGFCLCSFHLCSQNGAKFKDKTPWLALYTSDHSFIFMSQVFFECAKQSGSFTCWLCGLAVTIRLHSVSMEKQIVLT